MAPTELPLAEYPLLVAEQVGIDCSVLNEVFEETLYEEVPDTSEGSTALRLNRVILSYFELFSGHTVHEGHTTSEPLHAYYFIYVYRGSASLDGDAVPPGHLICFNINERMDINWGGKDGHYVIVRIKTPVLQQLIKQVYSLSSPQDLLFPRLIPTDRGPGLTLEALIRSMISGISHDCSLFGQGITSRQTEELFLLTLLHHAKNFDGELERFKPLRNPCPALTKSVAYINDHLDKELNMEKIVEVSGVSARSLQASFAQQFGMGPMSWIKKQRLHRVRRELEQDNASNKTVTRIAARWGFTNPCNFSSLYRKEFGELPSATLKRFCQLTVAS